MPTLLITRFPYQSQLGGEEIHTINLAKGLIKKGWKIILWTSCPVLKNEFKKLPNSQFSILNSQFFPRPPVSKFSLITFTILSPLIFLYFAFKYLQILKANSYKLKAVYMMSLGEKLLLTPIILFYSFISSFLHSNIIWIEHARIGKWLTSNPWKILYKLWSRFVKIICVSKQSKKQLNWAHNVIDIPNGIDLEEFPNSPSFGKEKGLGGEFRIGVIARLSQDKGVDYLIKAILNIRNAELIIVGEGPEKEKLKRLAKTLPFTKGGTGGIQRVKFLGKLSRPDILTLYKNIDLFVLPSSEHDPFGLVIAEAMACKVPTVVTNVCGIADYIENEIDTKIVPPKDPNSMELAIRWYMENPKRIDKIVNHAHKRCHEIFDLKRMVDDYEKLFLS